jgi:probable F420-dependent oxidoreductase
VKFTVEHPVGQHGCAPELYSGDGIVEFAGAAEQAGYHAVAFTEHPAPSLKWLRGGGHLSLEPLSALAFCAAVTRRIVLQTQLLVLPYHQPLLVAKAAATVDRLSGGRLVIGAGGGYLRSEFAALGADFESRGAAFDRSLDVLRSVWSAESFSGSGPGWTAREVVSAPGPVQTPHPPLWIGGSGRNARRRVARSGQGWMPLVLGEQLAATTRTAALTSVDDLAAAVRELRDLVAEAGRDPAGIAVQVADEHGAVHDPARSTEQHRDHLGRLAEAGATWYVVHPPGGSVGECRDALAAYAADMVTPSRGGSE